MNSVEELQAVIASQQKTIAQLVSVIERLTSDEADLAPAPSGYLNQRG